jgi:hypothetical protein
MAGGDILVPKRIEEKISEVMRKSEPACDNGMSLAEDG